MDMLGSRLNRRLMALQLVLAVTLVACAGPTTQAWLPARRTRRPASSRPGDQDDHAWWPGAVSKRSVTLSEGTTRSVRR